MKLLLNVVFCFGKVNCGSNMGNKSLTLINQNLLPLPLTTTTVHRTHGPMDSLASQIGTRLSHLSKLKGLGC